MIRRTTTTSRTTKIDPTSLDCNDSISETSKQKKARLHSSTPQNMLQRLQAITENLPIKLNKKFKDRDINKNLIKHLSHQKTKIDKLEDFNDANEMQTCTRILAANHSDVKLSETVIILFEELDKALEEKKCTCICQEVFNNLEREMLTCNDDYLTKYLRNYFSLMLDKAQKKHYVKRVQNVSDIFFWGTFPLKEAYERKYFEQELYKSNAMQRFNKDIAIYLSKMSKKIERLKICHQYLKMDLIGSHNIVDLKGRIGAKISILERPIPMMMELYDATL